MKAFILAGQSNMQGFGKISDYSALRDERIFNLATGKAEVAVEPLHHWHEHPYMPEGVGLGLAMPFALEVLNARPNITIGFIPAACGGSSLNTWMPGNANFERAINLYERAERNSPDIELAGILWLQGEADASDYKATATYGERFIEAMRGFRQRLCSSQLPIIAGETCRVPREIDNEYYRGRPQITEQTRNAIVTLGRAAFATSEGLGCDEDYTHFNTESIRIYGLRYAAAYLKLVAAETAMGCG